MNKSITLDNLKKLAIRQFNNEGIDTAALDTRVLLQFLLSKPLEYIIANGDVMLDETDVEKFNQLIKRRISGEPISQIIGSKEFYGYEYMVTKDTLTPRPDSETLIEAAFDLFPNKDAKIRILDLGTGTGCLSITLLKHYPNAEAIAVDLSDKTLEIAKLNSMNLQVRERIKLIQSDWFSKVEGKFDLIISNPPYISLKDKETLAREVLFEPNIALFAGDDGLDCYRAITSEATKFLQENGVLIMEIGNGQEDNITNMLVENGYVNIIFKRDLSNITRCIVASLCF
jgi:release factor glutamine methyltransferase